MILERLNDDDDAGAWRAIVELVANEASYLCQANAVNKRAR